MIRFGIFSLLLICSTDLTEGAAQVSSADKIFYANSFSDSATLAADFTVLDFPSVTSGPSAWSISNGILNQTSNIYGPVSTGTGIPYEKGTFLLYKEALTGDWDMQVKFKASDNDGVGLVFHYKDNANFNWVEWDAQDSILAFCRAGKRVDTGTVLASAIGRNLFKNTGYKKPTAWEKAQGLASDSTHYYYAGHHDADSLEADIHVIRKSDLKEIAVFENAGPMHSAELDMFGTHGTLLACSGGDGRHPYVWELSVTDGEQLNVWDFKGTGENGGSLVSSTGGNDILLFTSSDDGAKIAFTQVTLGNNGGKTIGKTWKYSATDLGVPQGMDYVDGYIYYLADAGPTVKEAPHYIYKIKLDSVGTGITIVEKYLIPIAHETEGLDISSDHAVAFGSAEENIYVINQPLERLSPDPGGYRTGVWYTLRVEKVGYQYRIFVDGDLRLSRVDSTFVPGKPGLMSRGSTGLQFDDFSISVPVTTGMVKPNRRQQAKSASTIRPGVHFRKNPSALFNLTGQKVEPNNPPRK